MNTFRIYWSDKANFDQIAALEKAIKKIEHGDVEQKDGYFEAELEWGTTPKDVGNLKGKLNNEAKNIVTKVVAV